MTEEAPQISTLYNGEVTIAFDNNNKRSRYKISDKGEKVKAPSVTTITNLKDRSGPLMRWAVNCAVDICREKIKPDEIHGAQYLEAVWKEATEKYDKVKKKAADTGTLAHNALENFFKLPPEEFAPPLSGTPVRARFDEAIKWFYSHKIKSIETETTVYSREHGYVGRLDHVSEVEDILSLLDYKSSKHIYNSYIFQASAYIKAWEEERHRRINQIYILQIGEEKTIPYRYNRDQIEIAFRGFLGLLQMYNSDKALGKTKPEENDWLEEL